MKFVFHDKFFCDQANTKNISYTNITHFLKNKILSKIRQNSLKNKKKAVDVAVLFAELDLALFLVFHVLGNSERDGNTRPPDMPLEKFVCRSGSNS